MFYIVKILLSAFVPERSFRIGEAFVYKGIPRVVLRADERPSGSAAGILVRFVDGESEWADALTRALFVGSHRR